MAKIGKGNNSINTGDTAMELVFCTLSHYQLSIYQVSDKPRIMFFLLVNVKMPTTVGILTFMSRKKFMQISLGSDFRPVSCGVPLLLLLFINDLPLNTNNSTDTSTFL